MSALTACHDVSPKSCGAFVSCMLSWRQHMRQDHHLQHLKHCEAQWYDSANSHILCIN